MDVRDPSPDRAEPTAPPPSLADGVEHPVDPRTVRIGRIFGISVVLVVSMLPLIFFTLGWALGGIPGPIYLGVLGVWSLLVTAFLLLAYRWPAARHKHLRYLVEPDGLRIQRGVFWRKTIWIPITRVP